MDLLQQAVELPQLLEPSDGADHFVAGLHAASPVACDLDALADQQLVIRSHGGASANPDASSLPMRYRAARNAGQKEAIAAAAVDLVRPSSWARAMLSADFPAAVGPTTAITRGGGWNGTEQP